MKTVITTHKNMDLDALGAVVGLKELYPEATVVLPETKGEEVIRVLKENPEVLEFVEESAFEGEFERLVIADTDSIERIPERLKELLKERKGVKIELFDHHGKGIEGAEAHQKEAGASTSIVSLILKGKGITPSPYKASVMLLGIYSDTGSFKHPSTKPIDFLAAAYLMSVGGEVAFVKKYLPKELSKREIDLLKVLKDNLKIVEVHGNPIGITWGRFDSYIGDVAPLISKLMEIYSLPALFGVIEVQSTTFLIGRSRSLKVDASKVAEAFRGGGHKEAASATVKGKTAIEVLQELGKVLKETVIPLKRAKDLMTSPPIVVGLDVKVKEARRVLMKNSINAAPVVSERGEVEGIVSRALLDKAVYMGLEESPVKEVMEREFLTVSPQEPISKVEEIIVEKQQSFLPVVEGRKVVGVITRTDLLMNYYKKEVKESEEFYKRRSSQSPSFRNVEAKLRKALPENLFNLIKKIGEIADREGINAYLVGGFVRDLIIGRKNYDIDVVVEGDATEFAKKVGSELSAKVHTFSRFKTANLRFEDGTLIDMASARTEVYRSPGALPEVESAPLKKDLMRRDFTINTLAVKINSKEFGRLIDYFGGLKDIKDKKIRVLHSLSFVEDPTRILRGLRFATRYRFTLGKHTEKLLKMAVERRLFKTVEGQRIYHELKQILNEENPLRVFLKLEKFGVLRELFPQIKWNREKKDLFERVRKLITWHKLNFPEKETLYHLTYLGALFHDEPKEKVENYLSFLSPPEKEKEALKRVLELLPETVKELKKAGKPSEVFKVLSGKPRELLLLIGALGDELKDKVLNFLREYEEVKPLITGNDLKELGLKPGPIYGEILKRVKYGILDGEVDGESFKEQLSYAKELINEVKSENFR
ncbi:CBS domain-containing protein [Thermovibrio sp.]